MKFFCNNDFSVIIEVDEDFVGFVRDMFELGCSAEVFRSVFSGVHPTPLFKAQGASILTTGTGCPAEFDRVIGHQYYKVPNKSGTLREHYENVCALLGGRG